MCMRLFGITITGTVGVGSLVTLATSLLGFLTVLIGQRKNRQHIAKVDDKVDVINTAVNGKAPDDKSMVNNVQDLHDNMVETNG
jgi:hypothetical protein